MHVEIAISAQRQLNMRRDSSFCAKSVRYNIFTNDAPQFSPIAARQSVFMVASQLLLSVYSTPSAKAVFATTQLKSAVFVIGSELPRHYCTIIGCVMCTCASQLWSWRLVLMEFTSGGRAVTGYSLMLLLFMLGQEFLTFFLQCTPSAFRQMSMYPYSISTDKDVPLQNCDR